MTRFRTRVLLWVFVGILVDFGGASDDTSNVMKISEKDSVNRRRPGSLLKYNTEQDQKNIANDGYSGSESFVAYDLQIVVDALQKLNYSQCGLDALTVIKAIAEKERWALQMFDASSKFPVGLLYGNFYQLGNFDECVNLRQPKVNAEDATIQGQYCLADVEFFNRKMNDGRIARSFKSVKRKSRHIFKNTIHWSICVPSSCTVEEVKLVVKEIFTLATEQKTITVNLNTDKCHVNKSLPLTTGELIYSCIIGAFCAFVILATSFHYWVIEEKKRLNPNVESGRGTQGSSWKEAILCFSLIKTIDKFLTTKSSSLNLECISGIKFLSMAFIVAGHTCLFLIGGPVQNTNFYEEESRSLANAIFSNSPLLVDTFLLVSGFLMSYLILLELDKRKGKLNILVLYIARYIRLTPSYMVIVGFYSTLLFRISDGPLWDSRIKQEQERCQKSWWTNLLYINNYVNTDHMCMFQSWYLAADYHLFIIAPLIIYPLRNWNRSGKIILGIGTLISVVTPFIITLKDKLDPTLMIFAPEVYDLSENFYFINAYVKTHMRAGSYFFGLFFGYLLYKLQTKGVKMTKFVLWFGWVLSGFCGTIAMSSIVVFYDPHHEYNAFEAAMYASFHRVAWCISIGWIMIACITNNATPVNRFLSWKPFIPLSRLTYCAYLINGFIEVYSFGSLRESTYMSKLEMGTKVIAHFVLTFSLAFLLCILFESPIHGLEKMLLRRSVRDNTKTQTNDGRDSTSM